MRASDPGLQKSGPRPWALGPGRWASVLVLCLSAVVVRAQTPQIAPADAQMLADGWNALSAGKPAEAAALAARVIAHAPESVAALALSVDASIANGGAAAGLRAYEAWLHNRRLETPYVLRRLAVAFLQEATANRQTPGVRTAALQALADDGDAAAAAQLHTESAGLPPPATPPGASDADMEAAAVNQIIETLNSGRGDRARLVTALAATHSDLAIGPLETLLTDPNPFVVAAAAEGLGALGAHEAETKLQALLAQPGQPTVHFSAAEALDRLGSASGTTYLWNLLDSGPASVRIDAAEAMAPVHGTDPSWQSAVRQLLDQPDTLVQLRAARLLAAADPDAASTALRRLAADTNPAIRTEAQSSLVDADRSFSSLRVALHGDATMSVHAAGRILALTR